MYQQANPALFNNWLECDVDNSEEAAQAVVRDSGISVEVIAVVRLADGVISLLSKNNEGRRLCAALTPCSEDARLVAEQRIRLPYACICTDVDSIIHQLERDALIYLPEWQNSPCLKGELFLIFDEDQTSHLGGFVLRYSQSEGLSYEKEEKGSGDT